MQHRRYTFFPSALAAVLLVAPAACSKERGTVERKSESTTQTAQGEVKTTTESKQVGNTLEAKTETKADTGSGTDTMQAATDISQADAGSGTDSEERPGSIVRSTSTSAATPRSASWVSTPATA